MSLPLFPPNAELLYTTHLNPNAYTLCGSIPNQYPYGIGIYIANNDPYSTVMTQVVITRHEVANDSNVFNQVMYIPSQNAAQLANFANIAGLNVFVKTTGTKVTVYIIYSPDSNGERQFISVTPNVINMDQQITPMPAPVVSNANSIGSQILQLSGQVTSFQAALNTQAQLIQQLQQQVFFLQTKLATILPPE